jgi:nucleotide-binding universal stress UspA family protein
MNPKTIKKILVGTDFSETSDAALAAAIGLAKMLGATLDVVHVLDLALEAFPFGLAYYEKEQEGVDAWVDRALVERAERARAAGVVCQTDALGGHPAAEIVRHAKKTGVDLIVVGTHGRTGIAHALLGSVAERVLHRSVCPVLAIPLPKTPDLHLAGG